jgi:hypothetical protein
MRAAAHADPGRATSRLTPLERAVLERLEAHHGVIAEDDADSIA